MDRTQLKPDEIKEVASADPFTVIQNAKAEIHKKGGTAELPWLEELASRFELQCRAGYGSQVEVGSTQSSRS